MMCPTSSHQLIEERDVTPDGLKIFIEQHNEQLRSPDDLVCCLPRSYRQNFVIMHSSMAAQNSDILGPRVISFGTDGNNSAPPMLQAALSINGGAHYLNNHNNIEIAYNNPANDEVEFYDFDFTSGHGHRSEKNPMACIRCHGTDDHVGLGGMKTVFEDFDQWTRAVQGIHLNQNEQPLARAIERATERVFRSNRRYRCLDQEIAVKHHFSGHDSSTAPELAVFDFLLATLNDRRVAKVIRQTDQYEKFKYAIIGSLACFDIECHMAENDSTINGCESNFNGWIPEAVTQSMMNTDFILFQSLKNGDILSHARAAYQESAQYLKYVLARQPSIIEKLDKGENPDIEIYRGPLNPSDGDYALENRMTKLSRKLVGPRTLDIYKADTEMRAVRQEGFNPFFRYLFEARGIGVSDFSMDMAPAGSYTRSPSILTVDYLMKSEVKGSPLQQLKEEMIAAQLVVPDHPSIDLLKFQPSEQSQEVHKVRRRVCEKLKSLSYQALSH